MAMARNSSLRGNPWVVALWVVSSVFVLSGLVAQLLSGQYLLSTVAEDFALHYVLGAVGPAFLMVGLAAAVAVMLLHASRWRPRE